MLQLSIITINRNNAEGLRKTIESVFAQTYRDFEYIVVDGASTDGSVEIIKDSAQQAASLDFKWISEPDTGIYDAMNKGIQKAKGEYCLFLNSGDVLANDAVLEELMANGLKSDIVSCNAILNKSQYHGERYCMSPRQAKASDLILSNLPHQATLIRTSLFSAIHMYDTSFKVVSDWMFFIEAILKYNASYQHIQMFLARCETEGISNNPANNAMMNEEFHRGLKKVLPLFYDDYVKLKYERTAVDREYQIFVNKFFLSGFGCFILTMRRWLRRVGYYQLKNKISQQQQFRKLQREDKILKREIASKIETLPANMLLKHDDDSDVIVSLTSYGNRVEDTAPYAIYSILTQSVLPNRIVLWLDKEHWNDSNLPPLLKRLQKSGLEISYCEDIRSYKKLLPSLKKFPNNYIIVIDDDFYYHKDFVKWMVEAYEQSDKRTVFATWGCIPEKINGKYIPYSQWLDCKYGNQHSEYSLFGGGGGYSPKIFDEQIFREDLFMKLCPTADDIWFWAQEKRLGIKTCLTEHHGYGLHRPINRIESYDLTQEGTLFYQNCILGKNDEQLQNVVDYYQL